MAEDPPNEIPDFDDAVDLLRDRLERLDALDASAMHSFQTAMADYADVLAEGFYWEAFEELESLGHLNPATSHKVSGSDACGRLSAEGRAYARYLRRSGEQQE